jgi:hypothetical protein
MDQVSWPSFGQVLDYLRELGFLIGPGERGYVVAKHPEDGSWFVFRERDMNAPARAMELMDMKVQLPGRGFVTDEEYARFWNPTVLPIQPVAPVSPQ